MGWVCAHARARLTTTSPDILPPPIHMHTCTQGGGDEVNDGSAFELNGQWYMLGNRTLLNLNLSRNGITDVGLKLLHDAIVEQEGTQEYSEGAPGLYRLSLQVWGTGGLVRS